MPSSNFALFTIKDLVDGEIRSREAKVKDFILSDSFSWNVEELKNVCPEFLVNIILETPLQKNRRDRNIWLPEKKGMFTVKSAYRLATADGEESSYMEDKNKVAGSIWKLKLPEHLKQFLWKLLFGVLPVGRFLAGINMVGDFPCPWCEREEESAEHVLFKCDWVARVWFRSCLGIKTREKGLDKCEDWVRFWLELLGEGEKKGFWYNHVGIFLMYQIWRERNMSKFQKKCANANSILASANALWSVWVDSLEERDKELDVITDDLMSNESFILDIWLPPMQGFMKINFDASFFRETGKGAAGAVCRDEQGTILSAAVRRFKARSPEEAEIKAAEVAVLLAVELNLTKVIIEGDSRNVVTALEDGGTQTLEWNADFYVLSIKELCSNFADFKFQYCNRITNNLAHDIAAWAMDETNKLPDVVNSAIILNLLWYFLGLEEKVRGAYNQKHFPHKFSSEEFVYMMLLDGCFIIQLFLLQWNERVAEKYDREMFETEFLLKEVQNDLKLVENQLPFSFLQHLFNLIVTDEQRGHYTFLDVAAHYFDRFVKMGGSVFAKSDVKQFGDLLLHCFVPSISYEKPPPGSKIFDALPNVSELHKQGVQFKKSDNPNLLDITFIDGVLEIPKITITSMVRSTFKNIIAMEQIPPRRNNYVTDYMTLMDYLIDTKEDVGLLKSFEIIDSYFGEAQKVTDLFNTITGRAIRKTTEHSHYYGMIHEINVYKNKSWNHWKVNVRRDYFSSPLKVVSLSAAFIGLVLTVVTTVAIVLSFTR